MSDKGNEEIKGVNLVDDAPEMQEAGGSSAQEPNAEDENQMPSAQQEEEVIKKKYGGLLPKKPPLISKDHERAFFDSADWALGKQGAQKSKGTLEALRPKLQPTHQQTRSRRSAYAPADDNEDGQHDDPPPEDPGSMLNSDLNSTVTSEDQNHQN